jgi:hypothetical protein
MYALTPMNRLMIILHIGHIEVRLTERFNPATASLRKNWNLKELMLAP